MKTFSSRTTVGLLALLAVGSMGLVGCGGDDEGPTTTDSPNTDATGMPNPASVYCEEQGGTVEIVDEPAGQVGFCNLPDGTRIDEWEYYRANN
ncbi:MAG: DUF333 domain-containing protein [Actinomycetota bacterium]